MYVKIYPKHLTEQVNTKHRKIITEYENRLEEAYQLRQLCCWH